MELCGSWSFIGLTLFYLQCINSLSYICVSGPRYQPLNTAVRFIRPLAGILLAQVACLSERDGSGLISGRTLRTLPLLTVYVQINLVKNISDVAGSQVLRVDFFSPET